MSAPVPAEQPPEPELPEQARVVPLREPGLAQQVPELGPVPLERASQAGQPWEPEQAVLLQRWPTQTEWYPHPEEQKAERPVQVPSNPAQQEP